MPKNFPRHKAAYGMNLSNGMVFFNVTVLCTLPYIWNPVISVIFPYVVGQSLTEVYSKENVHFSK